MFDGRVVSSEVIKEASLLFIEAYNDKRPNSIVYFTRINFLSGFSFEISEFDRDMYD